MKFPHSNFIAGNQRGFLLTNAHTNVHMPDEDIYKRCALILIYGATPVCCLSAKFAAQLNDACRR